MKDVTAPAWLPFLAAAAGALVVAGCSGGGGAGPDVPVDGTDADGDAGATVHCNGPGDCKAFPVGFCEVAVCSLEDGVCVAVADKLKEGVTCDPDDRCALTPKVCDGGQCVHTFEKPCHEKACKVGLGCDPATGDCAYADADDGTDCGDDPCMDGSCQGGACVLSDKCDDGDACTDDECDPQSGACTNAKVDCDDKNPCTKDACDQALGCTSDPDVGGSCDDGNECTAMDQCDAAGQCAGKDEKDCDDANPCTDDSCNPKTGDCAHVPNQAPCEDGDPCTGPDACVDSACVPGLPVPGCCNSGPDCDDGDPCTLEACESGTCAYIGEPEGDSGTGCVPGGACGSGFCDASSGQCREFQMTMPRALTDWDLTKGFAPAGFRWTAPGGVLGDTGATAWEVGSTAFRLPGHFAPAGIHVMYVYLDDGSFCQDASLVSISADGVQQPPVDCRDFEGAPVLSFAWTEAAPDRVDVEVIVQAGVAVARVTHYAWAASGCRPLGPVFVAPGSDLSDLALAGGPTGMMVGYRNKLKSGTVAFELDSGKDDSETLDNDNFTMGPGGFSTSLVPLLDGKYLFAYGGADQEVRVALVGADGKKISSAVPDLFTPAVDQQYEPGLARGGDGAVLLAYASSQADADGLGIVMTTVGVTGFQVGPFSAPKTANVTTAGDQRMPALAHGFVAFLSEGASGWQVLARLVSADGTPGGDEVVVASGGAVTVPASLTAADSLDRHFVAWQTPDGLSAGAVLSADLAKSDPIDLSGVGTGQYAPALVGGAYGALAVLTRVDGLDVNVVQARVSPTGAVSDVEELSGQVNFINASPTASRCGPFMDCAAFVDTWAPADKGAYVQLTSGACAKGPVDCTKPAVPGVCTGFGDTGYRAFAGASGWCPK